MAGDPNQIGPYRIDREIGRGGMGVVYLGRDTRLDRPVAIKSLPEHLAQDPDRLNRFEREARMLAQLNHANVAGIYGVEDHEGAKYLVLEYVEGETLAERLDRGPLPVDEAVELCAQIAAGVEAAHEQGVIHRDLKPANIKITPEGKVKVLDFGLAKASESISSSGSSLSESPTMSMQATPHSPTIPGAILGTAPYMSPEQARGRTVDKRTDIWSFGVVLYECLVGASPFVGETISDSIGAILHKDPDLGLLPQETPHMAHHVLRRCLERDKSQRLRDIGDARIELELLAADDSSGAAVAYQARTRHSWGLTAIITVLVSVIASGVVWLKASGPAPSEPEVVRFALPFADLLDMSGLAFQALAISPDGSTIIHSAGRSGRTHLYLQRLDEAEPRLIPGTEGGRSPFFSSDGKRLGFFSQGQVKWMPLSGGSPLTVASFPGLQFGADWLPDGSIICAASLNETLSIVPAAGGAPRSFETDIEAKSIGAYRWPHMLPDGEHCLVTYIGTIGGVAGPHLLAINIETGKAKVIARGADARYVDPGILVFLQGETMLASRFDLRTLELQGQPRSLELLPFTNSFGSVWTVISRNGTLVYVPAGASRGSGHMVWADRTGRTTPISNETSQFYAPRLSPDESKIVYWSSRDENAFGVYIHDIRQGRSFPVRYDDNGVGSYPIWSRDGLSIEALCNVPGEGWSWRTTRADGSGVPELLSRLNAARLTTSLNPSGPGGIGYEVNPVTNRDVWLVKSHDEMSPLIATPANERAPRISPNGRWFAFVSDRTGQDEVFVSSYPEGKGLILISTNGGSEPVWSHDGSELFYRIDDSLMVVKVQAGDVFDWSPPTELFTGRFLKDYFGNANYDVSADGERFLMVQTEDEEEWEMRVVLNWTTELKELLADR